eukprot:6455648-Amphidinium_carterae.1
MDLAAAVTLLTGAINAVCGARTFLALDDHLKRAGLGTCSITPPKSLGGVGGTCDVLAAAEVPVALGANRVGLVSTAVCAGDIPFLIPLPLLASLGAHINTSAMSLRWPDGKTTKLTQLSSGHYGVALTTMLHEFSKHGRSWEFLRTPAHEHVPRLLRSALAQVSSSKNKKTWSKRLTSATAEENAKQNVMCVVEHGTIAHRPGGSSSDSWSDLNTHGTLCDDRGRREEGLRLAVASPDAGLVLGVPSGSSKSSVGSCDKLQCNPVPTNDPR